MKNEIIISTIGIVWLLLWASYIPHLVSRYPFQEHKGVKSLIDEIGKAPAVIKEESGLLNKNPKELEESVMRELRIEWVKAVSVVCAGLLAAFLLIKKKRSGRILALALASCLLLLQLISFIKYWRYKMSPEYWEIAFRHFPMQTVQAVMAVIVFMVTVILLVRASLGTNKST
jgi:hypothetical protein